ncbi:MAG TPA: hypothetical protein VIM00_11340 [Candidatus Acidoferrum sp.]
MFVACSYNRGPKEDAQDGNNLEVKKIANAKDIDYDEFCFG